MEVQRYCHFEFCAQPFTPRKFKKSGTQKFCSRRCKTLYGKWKNRGRWNRIQKKANRKARANWSSKRKAKHRKDCRKYYYANRELLLQASRDYYKFKRNKKKMARNRKLKRAKEIAESFNKVGRKVLALVMKVRGLLRQPDAGWESSYSDGLITRRPRCESEPCNHIVKVSLDRKTG